MTEWSNESLDPADWDEVRLQAHLMLDDMLDYLEHTRDRPVWQAPPEAVRMQFREPLPQTGTELDEVHRIFMTAIAPYAVGNTHPGFFGWVHGGGSVVGMLAEMLAGGLNANLGGRNQIPVEVEREVVRWVCGLFEFPESASGILVTGTSMATYLAVVVARTRALGVDVRCNGLGEAGSRLVAYTSEAAHASIAQALDLAGIGIEALRKIAVDGRYRLQAGALEAAIIEDRRAGLHPFLIVGTAGSVDIGAIDDLDAIAEIAARYRLWFHIDGAFGALAKMSETLAPLLKGIERADSIAFDFHKWAQVPYDAGCLVVRNGDLHYKTFAAPVAYLKRETQGLAAGSPWPCDFGPDLSRGFRALKIWFTLKVYGTRKLAEVMENTCHLANYLASAIDGHPELELLAPVGLNIVCFRFCTDGDGNALNSRIATALQESGVAAPSTTVLQGNVAIRVAIVNHRTRTDDLDALLCATLQFGREFSGQTTLRES
ncbi:cytochrome D ubiquinol oxidase subunit I [Candidatus Methylospira mobilis]|uniref:Cytochrome D ubiquinol oxidase subunit I n=1 Tax=Candidatus Methylospira mobilis TaxID=1808979 RepID=A0A5Q0BNQ6_9GAMM|nr:pyridoxal-dependent decarboxylase [Candidatus Methylospira mobilis]QFY43881.1 cytochrome D ubiquinol oxidase subunit I [Candidatus Methylospira mobilis]